MIDAGFSQVEVVDTGADLNTYAKVENQSGCCSTTAITSGDLPVLDEATGCCSAPVDLTSEALHKRLADLLQRYNVNDHAASVRVFAVKPSQ